ncbi:MAG: hypothetical protein NC084_01880 [Bacteroides sp.]|nr:hypothetical protein [Eubacterium sp.]MCM1417364.1 hypothetical protein [Roseburia sp.]MCM1461444.1 hypothetical protein [Bacteroides sp.]
MTQTSCNYTGRYFRFVFGKLKGCFIFSVLFSVFFLPPFCLSYHEMDRAADTIFRSLSIISVIGLIVVTFVTPLVAMKHLYKKTEADAILSLPLTAAQRYFSELGAVTLCLAVPFAVISFPFTAIVQPTYVSLALHGLLYIVSFSVFHIFLMTLCGRLTEAILYPIALNILIPLVIWFGMHLGLMNIYGCGGYLFSSYMTYSTMRLYWAGVVILSFLSPFGNIYATMAFGDEAVITVVMSLLFIAIMIPLGLLTYSRRRAERIGRSFVYKSAYTATSVFVAFSLVVCFFWAAENFLKNNLGKGFFDLIPTALPVLAVGLFLLLLLMEAIDHKKVKSLPKLLVKYVGVLAAGTLVSFALYESGGFGESAYVPTADETVYVTVLTVDWSPSNDSAQSYMSVAAKGDGELAEYFRSVHRELTRDREEGEKYYNADKTEDYVNGRCIEFQYYLKNGQIITREYPTDIPEGFRTAVVESEEYRYSDLVQSDITLGYDHWYSDVTWTQNYAPLEEIEPVAVRLTNPALSYSNMTNAGSGCITFENIDYGELRAALMEDLKNDPAFGRRTDLPIGKLEVGEVEEPDEQRDRTERAFYGGFFTLYYSIYADYTNTLSFLYRSATPPTEEETVANILDRYEYFTLARFPVVEKGQDVISFSRYGVYGRSSEALITGEQFIEALSHSATYILGNTDRSYVYAIIAGAPNAAHRTVGLERTRDYDGGKTILISEEFYDVLDEWFEAGYIPSDESEE